MFNFNKVKLSSGFRKYFKNTSWLMFDKIIRVILTLFISIWIARYLSPDKFGMLSYARAFLGFFVVFATLGLDQVVVKLLVTNPEEKNKILGTAFILKLCGSIVVIFICSLLYMLNRNDSNFFLIFILSFSSIFQTFNVIDFYFQSKVAGKKIAIVNIYSLILTSLLKVILILLDASLIFFIYAIVIESILISIGLLYFYISDYSILNWKFNYSLAKKLLHKSWPLILSGFIISIYMRIDQIMIKEFLNNEMVGQYAAAVRISEAWYFVPVVITNSIFPAIINVQNRNSIYLNRLQYLYDLMVWLGIIVALPVSLNSEYLINFLYGENYKLAAGVLTIHIWTGVFVFLGIAFNKYLIVENCEKKTFYRALSGVILNIPLNLIMIPQFGIIGAAYATFISQIVANYIYDIFDKQLRFQFIMKSKSFFPIHLIDRVLKQKN